MKLKITLLIFALTFAGAFAQNRKSNLTLEKGSSLHRLYVSIMAPANGDSYNNAIAAVVPGFEKLVDEYSISSTKAITFSGAAMERLESLAIKNTGSGESVTKLDNIFELSIANPTNERLMELGRKLEKMNGVEYCSLMSAEPVKPPYDIAPITPSYENQQLYLTDYGVHMTDAWAMGLNGQGINVRDVEYGVNLDHEDLNEKNVSHAVAISSEVTVDFAEHGTAVFGVMFADKGTYGVSGMAHGMNQMVLHTEYPVSGYNRLQAVIGAVNNSDEGDIIVYELQMTGALGDYCPAEYDNIIWDLTKAATNAGIIVVAAAGNGAEDLDDPAYQSYMDRGDSGAIIVGAGANNSQHNRLDFSTYGSRVNVHGWGQGVYTTGYGNAVQIGGDFNQGYTNFSGTSSATPIVASCVAVLLSYYHGLTGEYLTCQEMRELLIATGTPQGAASQGTHIGPLPNMEAAIAEIANMLGAPTHEKASFSVYPNPVQDRLTVNAEGFAGSVKAEVYNSLGQLVNAVDVSAAGREIDFSGLSGGVYFVKVSDGDISLTKRVIKK
ncbi:S8 family peptidase [Flavobacterium sp. MFBS3-15]|uniref:S8 family peptidase n=1 Tax=Flavobacterium sp. MFBS3-15 TaxID=2989816 RepID=UPI0022357C5D|nr:S8 family peptidase [Flavobacterium sp. MFBS3-15]MCW4470471.1 S8 family peptidase [Flavobacterium sp. MFBS3-15]